jgi:hypothetical protein
MTCFVCAKRTPAVQPAEIYSHESCMCEVCYTEYVKWSLDQDVDPATGEYLK